MNPDNVNTPPRAPLPKIHRKGGREIMLNRQFGENNRLVGRKYSPRRLLFIIKCIAEVPVVADVLRRATCSRTALEYWLKKSERGTKGDGFDLQIPNDEDGQTERFHILFRNALKDGVDRVEKAAYEMATGYEEPLHHHGRVKFKLDPDMVKLGIHQDDPLCWLYDKNTGKPIPETIFRRDPEMIRWIMERRRPDDWGRRDKVDVSVRGGVVFVPAKMGAKELDAAFGGKQPVQDVEFEEVTDEVENDPTR